MAGDAEPLLKGKGKGDDGVDVVGLLAVLWFHRKTIARWTAIATLLGVAYALLAKPVYHSYAVISPREVEEGRGMARFFSQLGGGVGAIAAQLGGGGGNLEKTALILKSNELAETVITRHNLMPLLYPKAWDSAAGTWKQKNPKRQPNIRKAAKMLREDLLEVNVDPRKGVLVVKLAARKDTLAKDLVQYYLAALNDRIREDVLTGAERDWAYLEEKMLGVSDPYLRGKLQDLIAAQVEKSMLVRHEAFDVLEKPLVPLRKTSPKRARVVVIAFLVGVLSSCLWVFARIVWLGLKRDVSGRLRT